jgi:acyl CoA:acetate/3-ketoacid CoA transferase beta subunit
MTEAAGATRAEVCVVACAEAWRGDGEILASPMGTIPSIGARLARLTFEPDLLLSDGEAYLLADTPPVGTPAGEGVIEGWIPYREVFHLLWSGHRHVMMGASQVDRFGNQNIACIGEHAKPKAQLLGVRGAPGNTVNHTTSYWVPKQSARVFVERVDMVSGVGYDRAKGLRYHGLRFVVTDLAVFDFETPDHSMRLRSVHPGVTADDVQAAAGFELAVRDGVPETRAPTADELRLIREVLDPRGLRDKEVTS